MKKSIFLFLVVGFIASCSNNSTSSSSAPSSDSASAGSTTNSNQEPENMSPDAQKGLQLVASSDCLGCHKISEQATGPAYEMVAQKYKDTPEVEDSLANKIIKGGSGKWGTAMMTPHPALSMDDAKLMVKYVLSLKNSK